MDNPTPFHENHERPAGYSTLPPPPPKTKIPAWAWGLGALLLALIITLIVVFSTQDRKEPEAVPAPAPAVTVTATPEPTREAEAAPSTETQGRDAAVLSERQFLAFLRETFPILTDVSDEEILYISDQSCDLFEEGKTPEEVLVQISGKANNADEAEALGGIVGASVSNYCPAYTLDVEKFLDEQGVMPAPQGA